MFFWLKQEIQNNLHLPVNEKFIYFLNYCQKPNDLISMSAPYMGISWARLEDDPVYKTFCIEEFPNRLGHDFRDKKRLIDNKW